MFENIKPIDPVAQRRRRYYIAGGVFLVLLAGFSYYQLKNFPEELQVRHFFQALQQQDFQKAYQLWQPTSSYTFNDFSQDWGPKSENGPIKLFHITGSNERGSGVVVRVMVNDKDFISLWVEKKNKSLSFPP